ncbi:MAG: translocation/assembly module TamB domain-containing protein, partial [Candidatus Velthaea sp.]
LTLIRHADGSFAFPQLGGNAPAAQPAGSAGEPLSFTARVRGGVLRLIDRAPVGADLAEQDVTHLDLDATVRSDARSSARLGGQIVARRVQGAPLERFGFSFRSVYDDRRGFAVHRIRAAAVPLRGLVDYFVHTPAFRVDGGMARDVDIVAYALDFAPGATPDYRIAGGATLGEGQFSIAPLIVPAREVRGRVDLYENGLTFTRIDGNVGGVPLRARGGLYDWANLAFRIGLVADGELVRLRRLFAFSLPQPLTGPLHAEAVIGGKVAKPIVSVAFSSPQIRYDAIPFDDASGRIAYYDDTVYLEDLRTRFGAAHAALAGRLLTGGPVVDTLVALSAQAPARDIPYAAAVAPDAQLDILGLLSGDAHGYVLRGTLGATGATTGRAFFRIDPKGDGEIGPFAFDRSDGSSLYGALRYERSSSQSGGWLRVDRYRLAQAGSQAVFPVVRLPAFPPLAGVFSGNVVGGGSPSSFALAGAVDASDARIAGLPLGNARAQLGGTLQQLALGAIRVRGPMGAFSGRGSVENGTVAITGQYDGSLQALRPATGLARARGAVRGPLRLVIANDRTTVQTSGVTLANAQIFGVQVERAAGTLTIESPSRGSGQAVVHVIAADASIGGSRAVAAEHGGVLAISAPSVPAAALAGTGLPLSRGTLSVFGAARLGTPLGFTGTVLVANGLAAGYPVAGDATIQLALPTAFVRGGTAALGQTFGTFAGRLDGIGTAAVHYDVGTQVALGDLRQVRHDLRLPVKYLYGSFAAQLRVRGSGAEPRVAGPVQVPEGSYNGLHFRAATALFAFDRNSIAARRGSVTVGSTRAAVDGSYAGPRVFDLALNAPRADLADFNDYFDDDGVLAGRGSLRASLRNDGMTVRASGAAKLSGLRVRALPFGTTQIDVSTRGATIAVTAGSAGAAGTIDAHSSVIAAGGAILPALRGARYDGALSVHGLDVGTWLPALGFSYPVLGTLDGTVTFDGRYPALGVGGDLALTGGSVAGYGITGAQVHAVTRAGAIAISSASADLGFAQLDARGTLALSLDGPLALDVHVVAADLGRAVHALAPRSRGFDLAGNLEANVQLGGSFATPHLEAGFDIKNARVDTIPIPRVLGDAALDGKALTLRDTELSLTSGSLSIAGELPVQLAPLAIGPPDAPVSIDLTAQGVELAQFDRLFPVGTSTGGTFAGRVGVEGTVRRPQLFGRLSLAKGSYQSNFERAPIKNVDAVLSFAQTSVALEAFHADVGSGAVDGRGQLDLPFAQTPAMGYAVLLRAKAAQLDFPAYGRGQVDGDLRLASGATYPNVSGDVTLSNAVIPFAALYRSAGSGGAANGPPLDLGLSIHANAGKNVRVRSAILDIGATGSVTLTGTLTAPRLAGTFTSTGGTFSTYNHAFRVQRGSVTFDPADGVVPTIDLVASSRVYDPDPDPTRNIAGSANITVTVTGPADAFKVSYESVPAYSETQIAGLLLDLPAILGAVNFNTGPAGTLRGVPGVTNVLLPPGVSPEQTGTITANQEIFSFVNSALTQHALGPVESIFQRIFGLSDLSLSVDYGGGLGVAARRQLGQRDFYLVVNATLSYPQRNSFGLELRPDPFTAASLTVYQQNGVAYLITNQTESQSGFFGTSRHIGVQPIGNRSGIDLTITRRYR